MPIEIDTGSENDKNPVFVWYQHNNMNCYFAQRSSIQDSIKHSFIVIKVFDFKCKLISQITQSKTMTICCTIFIC